MLIRETLKADPEALAKLMADHTRVQELCLLLECKRVW